MSEDGLDVLKSSFGWKSTMKIITIKRHELCKLKTLDILAEWDVEGRQADDYNLKYGNTNFDPGNYTIKRHLKNIFSFKRMVFYIKESDYKKYAWKIADIL